ncbi:hypothetical protein H5410_019934 [Solanum commersonii]|uniref:Uncharacterized protein n=1 Tax=Solanum commersonii TaxID=4109 RepID=A0A9J5Z8R2_SOLCO|nr:hypothetical protein H5410_019934 [Solanum commersonii]
MRRKVKNKKRMSVAKRNMRRKKLKNFQKRFLPTDASANLETTRTFTGLDAISIEYSNSVISNRVDLNYPLLNSMISTLALFCIFEERLHDEKLV